MSDKECYMNREFHQCCCQCTFHWEDHLHCAHDRHLTFDISTLSEKTDCICHIQRGWICAQPVFYPNASSNWPEHSIGCEMFMQKEITPLKEER